MKDISEDIRQVVGKVKPLLLKIYPEDACKKNSSTSWSIKEILGHLIDSALNNHQRLVRAAQNVSSEFPTYNQNQWVEVQHYNEIEWEDLVELFIQLNLHYCRILNVIPEKVFDNLVNIGKENPVTLRFVVSDYLRHLEHHLEKILMQKF